MVLLDILDTVELNSISVWPVSIPADQAHIGFDTRRDRVKFHVWPPIWFRCPEGERSFFVVGRTYPMAGRPM